MENNDNGIFPRCPKCGEGVLLPFSYKEDVFEKWKCSKCSHVIQKRENQN
jgi:ribosomal protein S27AE